MKVVYDTCLLTCLNTFCIFLVVTGLTFTFSGKHFQEMKKDLTRRVLSRLHMFLAGPVPNYPVLLLGPGGPPPTDGVSIDEENTQLMYKCFMVVGSLGFLLAGLYWAGISNGYIGSGDFLRMLGVSLMCSMSEMVFYYFVVKPYEFTTEDELLHMVLSRSLQQKKYDSKQFCRDRQKLKKNSNPT